MKPWSESDTKVLNINVSRAAPKYGPSFLRHFLRMACSSQPTQAQLNIFDGSLPFYTKTIASAERTLIIQQLTEKKICSINT